MVPELGETVSLLRGTELREMITLNAPVNAAIDDWLTWMRPVFMESYENYQYLRAEVTPGATAALRCAGARSEPGIPC